MRSEFADGSWELILVFVFLKYVILDAIFSGTNFSISGRCVASIVIFMCSFCSIHQFYWVSDRCRSEFELWWYFVRKKLSSHCWQSFFLFGIDYQTLLEFHKFERQSYLFGVDNAFLLVNGTCENLVFDFSFFLRNHVFLCVYHWCGFSRYKFFHFWSLSGWHNCFDELIFIHLFNYTGVVVVAEADLRCGDFCSKKLSSQIGSFH